MGCVRGLSLVWVMTVAMVAAIMVAENGRMCLALDVQSVTDSVVTTAKEAKESTSAWSSWAYTKLSGKLSIDKDLKRRSDDSMTKIGDGVSDTEGFVTGKLHAVSHTQMTPEKDNSGLFYEKAKNEVGASYETMKKQRIVQD